jgi:RNA polymerase sigma-70 factor (ECF subfamily)
LEESWNKAVEKSAWKDRAERFEGTVLPYLNAAYNLARWLTRNEHDAEDVVQEAYLRAFRSFDTFQFGRDGRAWLLKIVRNTCYTWLRENRPSEIAPEPAENPVEPVSSGLDPEAALIRKVDSHLLQQAIGEIQIEYREVLVLRELEELSYKDIAQLLEVPLGTVMSRLSRGRKELQARLQRQIASAAS